MPNIIEEIKDASGNVVRRRVHFQCEGSSLTKQAMKAECDINGIMKRFEKTGVVTHLAQRQAYFADLSAVPDFATAIDVVRKAEEMFASLPARVRKEFNNDAATYVQFCSDPKNLDRMRELGIAEPVVKPEPIQVQVVSTEPPPVVTP